MRLSYQLTYPGANVVEVFRMICDEAFQKRKCQATGANAYTVQVEQDAAGGATIVTQRQMPTEQAPEFLRRLVGSNLQITETTVWQSASADGARLGSLIVAIDGTPVSMIAKLRLAAAADGAAEELTGELSAAVPLLGARIEKAVEPGIRAAVRVEQETGRAWLSETQEARS